MTTLESNYKTLDESNNFIIYLKSFLEMSIFLKFFLAFLLVLLVHSKSKTEWKSRVIYQVLTDRYFFPIIPFSYTLIVSLMEMVLLLLVAYHPIPIVVVISWGSKTIWTTFRVSELTRFGSHQLSKTQTMVSMAIGPKIFTQSTPILVPSKTWSIW